MIPCVICFRLTSCRTSTSYAACSKLGKLKLAMPPCLQQSRLSYEAVFGIVKAYPGDG